MGTWKAGGYQGRDLSRYVFISPSFIPDAWTVFDEPSQTSMERELKNGIEFESQEEAAVK